MKKLLSLIALTSLLAGPLFAHEIKEAPLSAEEYLEVKKLWLVRCSKCHNIRSPNDFDETRWDLLMFHMRVQVKLTEEERQAILKFIKQSIQEQK